MKHAARNKGAASSGRADDTSRAAQHVADSAGSYFVHLVDRTTEVSIADVVVGEIDSSGPVDDFRYLDIGSVDREKKVFAEPKLVPLVEAPSRAKQKVEAGDVLVSMTRPNLNAVAMVIQELHGSIASTGFHVLRSPWLEPGFLYYLVQTDGFVDAMCDVVQGALYPAVRPRDIESFRFNLPPRAEQTRIVEKLEELLSDLDAGVAELKAAQRKLAQYRQSLLKAAVEGTLTADWRAARAQSGEPQETGAALLQRILTERRTHWETRQLAKFAEQGKSPPKDWKAKYPQPVAPKTINLPKLPKGWVWVTVDHLLVDGPQNGLYLPASRYGRGSPILRIDDFQSDWIRSIDKLKLVETDAQALTNTIRVREILSLYERMKQQITALTRSQYAITVLDTLFDRPIFQSGDFVQRSHISKQTALPFLRSLRDAGVLHTLREPSGSRSAIYAFRELLNCAEGRQVL